MDYPHPKFTIENGEINFSNAYASGIGEWDKVAVEYAYTSSPEGVNEKHELNKILKKAAADGLRYRSYFDLLTDDIFSGYSGYGLYPSDFIITETQRNADPLTCEGETFTTRGSLPSWIFNI